VTVPIRPTREVTPIPPAQEAAFRAWLQRNRVTDLDEPDAFYDYRGAFMAGLNRDGPTQHWPDTFKQHGHPTFSVESKYSAGPDDGGHWDGDTFIPPRPAMPAKKKATTLSDVNAAAEAQRTSAAHATDLVNQSMRDPGNHALGRSADSAQYATNQLLGDWYEKREALKARHAAEMAALEAQRDATAVDPRAAMATRAVDEGDAAVDAAIAKRVARIKNR
jgi:hypothetical protein